MHRSVKEQARSGLRLGIGAGAFLIAMMLLGSGLTRVVSLVPPHHLVWSDWLGWVEISLACVMLLATAQVWFWLVGGYALFGLGKSILVLVSGKVPYTYRTVPRLEAGEAALFTMATLLLLFRFVDTGPNIMDRVSLTFYVLAIAWSGHSAATTSVDPLLAAGLIGLTISWCVYRWKKTQPSFVKENVRGMSPPRDEEEE
jgi:hypothetical protein